MALKTLQCCGDSSLPEQRSTLRAINTLNPPQNYIQKLGGLSLIHLTRRRGAQGLMWCARGAFLPAAAMVVAVVTPVVFCAKATEKRNKNTKISWWLPKSSFFTNQIVLQYLLFMEIHLLKVGQNLLTMVHHNVWVQQ
jgi:hypothetical protein